MHSVSAIALRLALVLMLASTACSSDDTSDDDADAAAGGSGGAGGAGGVGGAGGTSATGGSGGNSGAGVSGSGGSGASAGSGANAGSGGDEDAGIEPDSGADGGEQPLPDHSCLDNITDYAGDGPFQFETRALGSVKVWAPIAPTGCKLPVVHFANGTGATCTSYLPVLEHLASHGFVTACYESPNTGAGTQCIDAVEAVYAEFPALASKRQIGFAGNGTGGMSALVCTYRAEEKWGDEKVLAAHALPPDIAGAPGGWATFLAQIDSPVFIVNGSVDGQPSDGLVSEGAVRMVYEALHASVEAYWYEGVGATAIPVPTAHIEESAVAWFRWKLLGDEAACAHLKAMPDGDRWNLQEQQNAVDCN